MHCMELPIRDPCPLCATATRGSWTYEGRDQESAIITFNDLALAFVRDDRIDGYSFVIPRRHVPLITDLTADEARDVMALITTVAAAIIDECAPDGLNVFQNNGLVANQSVPHVHFHLAPRRSSQMSAWQPEDDRWSGAVQPFEARLDLARRLEARLPL